MFLTRLISKIVDRQTVSAERRRLLKEVRETKKRLKSDVTDFENLNGGDFKTDAVL